MVISCVVRRRGEPSGKWKSGYGKEGRESGVERYGVREVLGGREVSEVQVASGGTSVADVSASASREEHPEVLEAGDDGWWHLEDMNPLAILDWIYYIELTYRLLHVLCILHVPEVGPRSRPSRFSFVVSGRSGLPSLIS